MSNQEGHLKGNSINSKKNNVSKTDTIGSMGTTGSAVSPMLFLQVIDTEFEKYINPLLSLPLLTDNSSPLIQEVYILKDSFKIAISSEKIVKSGIFGFSADIRDLSEDAAYYCPLAPYSISLFINGENLSNISFESMKVSDGEMNLQVLDGILYNDLYKSEYEFFLGTFELSPGDVMIEISVKDFAGNEGVKIFPLKVVE